MTRFAKWLGLCWGGGTACIRRLRALLGRLVQGSRAVLVGCEFALLF